MLVDTGNTTAYVSTVFSRISLLGISSCPEIICSRLNRIMSHNDWAAFVCFCKTHKQKWHQFHQLGVPSFSNL